MSSKLTVTNWPAFLPLSQSTPSCEGTVENCGHVTECYQQQDCCYALPYTTSMETSATRLKNARLKAGFATAKAAAIRLGVSPSTYRSHENGQTPVPVAYAKRYARIFKTSADLILFGNNKENLGLDALLKGKPDRLKRLARRVVEAIVADDD